MLLRANSNNTNTNTESNSNNNNSFFPKTDAKSNGQGYTNQNKKIGEFTGKLCSLRPIRSKKNPTVFAVIEIAVNGEQGVFQDFLNFSSVKASESMSYLVNHTKSLITSAGYEADASEEQDMEWVENAIKELVENKAEVTFVQSMNTRGLSISYL